MPPPRRSGRDRDSRDTRDAREARERRERERRGGASRGEREGRERSERDRAEPRSDGRADGRGDRDRGDRLSRKDPPVSRAADRLPERPSTARATERSDRDKPKVIDTPKKLTVLESLKVYALQDGQGPGYNKPEIRTANWNHTGSRIAASRVDGSLSIWKINPKTGEQIGHAPMIIKKTHEGITQDLSWNPTNEEELVTVGRDSSIVRWNVVRGTKTEEINTNHHHLKLLRYSPDGKYIAAISKDTILFIDAKTNEITQKVTFRENAYSLCWCNTSDAVFIGLGQGAISLLMKNYEGEFAEVYKLEGHRSTINSLALDPKGKFLAAASHEGIISLWSLSDLNIICTIGSIDESIDTLDISHDGSYIGVTFKEYDGAKIYRVSDGKELLTVDKCIPGRHFDEVIRFSPVSLTYLFTSGTGEVFTGVNSGDRGR